MLSSAGCTCLLTRLLSVSSLPPEAQRPLAVHVRYSEPWGLISATAGPTVTSARRPALWQAALSPRLALSPCVGETRACPYMWLSP